MSTTRWLLFKARAGRVLLVVLVVTAAAGVIWYRRVAVETEQQSPAVAPGSDTKADMVTRDFRHVETRMDRTIWILESAQAEIFGEKARLQTVKITWYGEPGMLPVVITSAEGLVNFQNHNAILNGKVRVERVDGAVLTTEQLTWDERRKILRAPLPVVITTPNFTFQGQRLDANLTTQQVVLRGRVQGEVRTGALVSPQPS